MGSSSPCRGENKKCLKHHLWPLFHTCFAPSGSSSSPRAGPLISMAESSLNGSHEYGFQVAVRFNLLTATKPWWSSLCPALQLWRRAGKLWEAGQIIGFSNIYSQPGSHTIKPPNCNVPTLKQVKPQERFPCTVLMLEVMDCAALLSHCSLWSFLYSSKKNFATEKWLHS